MPKEKYDFPFGQKCAFYILDIVIIRSLIDLDDISLNIND